MMMTRTTITTMTIKMMMIMTMTMTMMMTIMHRFCLHLDLIADMIRLIHSVLVDF